MIVLDNDWRTLQLLADVIRDVLWDGGFKEMCYKCGYKKNMLILLHKVVLTHTNTITIGSHKEFWD